MLYTGCSHTCDLIDSTNELLWNYFMYSFEIKTYIIHIIIISQPNISRRSEIINTRTRIGHTNLTHIHLIKPEEQLLCSQCNEPLTIKHIVLDCPLYVNARTIILNQISSIEEALGKHNTHLIHSFFKYIGIDSKI